MGKPIRTNGYKYDAGKTRYSLIPPVVLKEYAALLTIGAVKYEDDNWKYVENARERYMDALLRHVEAYRGGEIIDPDTGKNHMYAAMCNAGFLAWFDEQEDIINNDE